MFEYLGDRLNNAIKNIRGMGKITEENIDSAIREIRMALLEADVNYEVVKEFVKSVKEEALGEEVSKSIKPDELFIKMYNIWAINPISLLIYCINHLKESEDKQSVNTLLDYALEQYIKKITNIYIIVKTNISLYE